ncbi:hypothetical protein EON65_53495 [archaeon]|nr:MAG: hypothetical protein EON65_53495 [archaeon]
MKLCISFLQLLHSAIHRFAIQFVGNLIEKQMVVNPLFISRSSDVTSDPAEPEQPEAKVDVNDSNASNSSRTLSNTVMENILGRFSFIEDHQVRGNWRYVFSTLTIVAPLVVFGALMWYFLVGSCIPTSETYGPLAQNSLDFVLAQSYMYYCASGFSQYMYSNATFPVIEPTYVCCNLKSKHHKSFNFEGACGDWKTTAESCPLTGNPPCFDSGGSGSNPVTVLYAQCTPVSTALVSGIQYSFYLAIIFIYFYVSLRVVKKHGFAGLCTLDNWRQVMSNKQLKEKEEDTNPASSIQAV